MSTMLPTVLLVFSTYGEALEFASDINAQYDKEIVHLKPAITLSEAELHFQEDNIDVCVVGDNIPSEKNSEPNSAQTFLFVKRHQSTYPETALIHFPYCIALSAKKTEMMEKVIEIIKKIQAERSL